MEYREIVSVTGLGGLYQLLATKNDGAIVKSLADQSTKFISARKHQITPLESIEVYTTGVNVRLHEVLAKMKDSATIPDPKSASNQDIKAYFLSVFEDLDEERVYVSDMKKMIRWFHILKDNDLLDFKHLEEAEDASEDTAETAEKQDEKEGNEKAQPAKKTARKKKTEEESPESATEATAAKKTSRKKKTEEDSTEVKADEQPVKKTARKKKTEE